MTDLLAHVAALAAETPDRPASLALSAEHWDELCRTIPVYPVTPLAVAALRLKEKGNDAAVH